MAEIMVIPRSILFSKGEFQGFSDENIDLILNQIRKNYRFVEREKAEHEPLLKQPIAYCILCNPENKIFAYQRASKKQHYSETRLYGKWSWGVGGHIEKHDIKADEDPLITSLVRELEEEVNLSIDPKDITVLGFINDDSDSVGQVHFGLLCLIRVHQSHINTNEEIVSSGMYSLDELKEIIKKANVENWSRIALSSIGKMFNSSNK
jgi:predicted NUDIX family phosphoesterase